MNESNLPSPLTCFKQEVKRKHSAVKILFHYDIDTCGFTALYFEWLVSFSYHVIWMKLVNKLGYIRHILCKFSCDKMSDICRYKADYLSV